VVVVAAGCLSPFLETMEDLRAVVRLSGPMSVKLHAQPPSTAKQHREAGDDGEIATACYQASRSETIV
jgi:hypothetical protein